MLMMAKTRRPVETLPAFANEALAILQDIADTVRANVADPLTIQQVSILTNLGVRTIHEMVATGDFPRPSKRGASSRWRRSDVDAWRDSLQE